MEDHSPVGSEYQMADTPAPRAAPVPILAIILYVIAALLASLMFPIVLASWPENLTTETPVFPEFVPFIGWLTTLLFCPTVLVGIGQCLTSLRQIEESACVTGDRIRAA